jgi:hypothetical protein
MEVHYVTYRDVVIVVTPCARCAHAFQLDMVAIISGNKNKNNYALSLGNEKMKSRKFRKKQSLNLGAQNWPRTWK